MNNPNQPGSVPGIVEYESVQLKPVGVVHNKSRDASWGASLSKLTWKERAARMKAQRDSVSEIVLDGVPEEILDGIEEFSHITVIYWAHLVPPERRTTTRVHPIGNPEFPLVGVYATRSPVRPNSILVTPVKLLERIGNRLRVTGLDALDGSLVLDIKPYTPARGELKEASVPLWIQSAHREFDSQEEPAEKK